MGATSDPDIQALAEHLRQADLLDPAELRALIPSLLILERAAVQEAPPFDAEAIAWPAGRQPAPARLGG